jgi:hypothetical protein
VVLLVVVVPPLQALRLCLQASCPTECSPCRAALPSPRCPWRQCSPAPGRLQHALTSPLLPPVALLSLQPGSLELYLVECGVPHGEVDEVVCRAVAWRITPGGRSLIDRRRRSRVERNVRLVVEHLDLECGVASGESGWVVRGDAWGACGSGGVASGESGWVVRGGEEGGGSCLGLGHKAGRPLAPAARATWEAAAASEVWQLPHSAALPTTGQQ